MSEAEVLDPESTEEEPRALEVRAPSVVTITPAVDADDLVARLSTIRDAADKAMQEGVDYGRIPGIDKPSLFKPGAEKLGVLFQLDIQLDNEKQWGPDDHLTVISHATVFHAPTGSRLGYGEGICTTREKKYGKRKQERVCPNCNVAAVIKGKKEYGGGWLCWKKKDGCGSKWPDGAAEIESQDVGEIDNPDIPDTWNTVVKMAEKRARVDAVLAVTGASALFTQDVEDTSAAPAEEPGGDAGVAPTSPVEAAAAPPGLISDERRQELRKLFDRSGMKAADLKLVLLAVGIDAKSVNQGLGLLTPELADHLQGELERMANA